MPLRLASLGWSSMLYEQKFIVCSPDLIAATCGSSVAFYRHDATSWSVCPPDAVHGREWGWYVDLALYRGKIYALNRVDDLFVYEVGEATATAGKLPEAAAAADVVEQAIKAQGPQSSDPEEEKFIRRWHYLVVSCTGKLLMVKWTVPPYYRRRSPREFDGITVEVLEADLDKGRWLEVKSLDNGEALFVGRGSSKAVRFTGNDERFQGNRVYVLGYENFFGYCCDAMPSYGFYDLRSGAIVQVLLDRLRLAAWPVSRMEWFFPQE